MEAEGDYEGVSAETLNAAYSRVCELMAHGYCSMAAKGKVLTLAAQWFFIQIQHASRGKDKPSAAEEFGIAVQDVLKNARKLN
jgi:hypothetical protein